MVHALEIVHSLIKPGGLLVDIHPLGDPPAIQVLLQGQTIRVGWLQESDDFIEYSQATDALAQAITRGWFALDQQDEFIFITHATSWEDLENYLKVKWHDAILPEGAALKVQRLRDDFGAGIEIALEERIGIKTLVALRG